MFKNELMWIYAEIFFLGFDSRTPSFSLYDDSVLERFELRSSK